MANIRLRNVFWSILAAIVLVICLGLGTTAMILLIRGEDAIENTESDSEEATACEFTSQIDPLYLYHAPVGAPSQQKTSVPGREGYPIIKQNRGYYLVQAGDDLTGWAYSRDGTVNGECDDIPVDETALIDFPTVCAFTNTGEVMMYSEADLTNPVGAVPPGTHLVEVINADRYYLIVSENISGWVIATDGQLSGACDAIAM
jgi:hypothetical protein